MKEEIKFDFNEINGRIYLYILNILLILEKLLGSVNITI